MSTILITGGTGLIGKALSKKLLESGHEVIVLTRDVDRSVATNNINGLQFAAWDLNKKWIDAEALSKADTIIHLAGANVAEGRWTTKRKWEIQDSRISTGKLLVHSLSHTPNKVKKIISASAIGWYGPDKSVPNSSPFIETDAVDLSYLGETCLRWENALEGITALGITKVTLRIGIVLSPIGGALKEFLKPLQFGLATIMGSGKQIVSWIHIDDLVSLIEFSINNESINGIYNAVAPHPISNEQLVKTMASLPFKNVLKKFSVVVKVPALLLKIALGEMSVEVLKSATVSSQKIQAAGFSFKYDTIKKALVSFINS
jgi:uncharacterized protein (TIGR01777 family)